MFKIENNLFLKEKACGRRNYSSKGFLVFTMEGNRDILVLGISITEMLNCQNWWKRFRRNCCK